MACKRKYQKENPEKARERRRKYYKENPEKSREYHRKYYKENPEKSRERMRKWRKENPEKVRENYRKWQKENPEKCREYKQRRRARISNNISEPYDFEAICAYYEYCCLACGDMGDLTVDHVVPVSKGGADAGYNIQPLCQGCNSEKGVRVIEFRYSARALYDEGVCVGDFQPIDDSWYD